MRTLSVEASIHGRVLVRDAAILSPSLPRLVGFHGYGQNAEDMLAEIERIPGSDAWQLVSIQALHPFYARNEERVIASWMTRQDRELAVADNVAYVDRVLNEVVLDVQEELVARDVNAASPPIIFIGFSQGAAMAYRAGMLGRHRPSGIIALGGDIPPELRDIRDRPWPPLLIGAGATDFWYTPAKVATDVAFLASRQIPFQIVRFAGGHEWTDEFREAAAAWLARFGVPGRP